MWAAGLRLCCPRGGAAEVHGGGEAEVAQPHRLLELEGAHAHVGPGEAGVQEEAVEVSPLEARIRERELHGVDREAERRAAVDPPLGRDAEADDGGGAGERMGHAKRRDSPWRSTATRSVSPRSRASSSSQATGSSIGSYETTNVPQWIGTM